MPLPPSRSRAAMPHQGVVATSAAQHVGAATAVEDVIAEATDEVFVGLRAAQGVIASAA